MQRCLLLIACLAASANAQTLPAKHFADVFIGHFVIQGTPAPYAVIWTDDDTDPNYGVGFGKTLVKDGQIIWTQGNAGDYVLFTYDATSSGRTTYWITTKQNWDFNNANLVALIPESWVFTSFVVSSKWIPPTVSDPVVWEDDGPRYVVGNTSSGRLSAIIVLDPITNVWEWSTIDDTTRTDWAVALTLPDAKLAAEMAIGQ